MVFEKGVIYPVSMNDSLMALKVLEVGGGECLVRWIDDNDEDWISFEDLTRWVYAGRSHPQFIEI